MVGVGVGVGDGGVVAGGGEEGVSSGEVGGVGPVAAVVDPKRCSSVTVPGSG